MVQRYLNRISGPLPDRIAIHSEVVPVNYEKLSAAIPAGRGGPGNNQDYGAGSIKVRLRVLTV